MVAKSETSLFFAFPIANLERMTSSCLSNAKQAAIGGGVTVFCVAASVSWLTLGCCVTPPRFEFGSWAEMTVHRMAVHRMAVLRMADLS